MSRFTTPITRWATSPSRRWKEGSRCRRSSGSRRPARSCSMRALLTHMGLGFWALYERRQFRWTRLEATQLAARPDDPVPAADHVFGTRVVAQPVRDRQGLRAGALQVRASPPSGLLQTVLLLIVWTHGCIGVHFWLALKPFYPRVKNLLLVGGRAPADAGAPRLRPGPAGDSRATPLTRPGGR